MMLYLVCGGEYSGSGGTALFTIEQRGIMITQHKPMIYIAGPYTKPDPAVNTRNAILAGQEIRESLGVCVVVPHVTHFEHMLSPRPYQYWLDIDIDLLRNCDAVFRLRGESSGADGEEAEAIRLRIPVFHELADLAEWVLEWKAKRA